MNINFDSTPPADLKPPTRSKYEPVARMLRERPGQWAEIDLSHLAPTSRAGFASQVRSGMNAALDRREFEALNDGGRVWLRYVGSDES